MQFFKFIDGVVELARPEIALYPTVNEILKRDKGGKIVGDPDGRKKAYAFKELTYVYFMCDFYAYPMQHALSDEDAHHYAVKHTGLPDHYAPDAVVSSLMEQYREEHLTIGKKTIKNLLDTFSLNSIAITSINTNLKLLLKNAALTKDQISEVIKYQQDLMKIATEVPQQVKKLREAFSLVQEEEKEILIRRGGEEVPQSMLPGNSIENDED